jgi:hypothetical protein
MSCQRKGILALPASICLIDMMGKPRPSPALPGLRRHVLQRLLILAIAFAITAMVGSEIKRTPPEYLESASVVFKLPRPFVGGKAETLDTAIRYPSLIIASDVMVQSLMNPEYQHLIEDAGGTAAVSLTMANANDEEYPAYPYPLATLTAQSASPLAAHHTFTVALRVLTQLVLKRQMAAAVPARSRMTISMLGDTGPVSQHGSTKRSLIALVLLAIIGTSIVLRWLEHSRRRVASLPAPPPRRAEPAASVRRPSRSRIVGGSVGARRRPAQHRAPRKR